MTSGLVEPRSRINVALGFASLAVLAACTEPFEVCATKRICPADSGVHHATGGAPDDGGMTAMATGGRAAAGGAAGTSGATGAAGTGGASSAPDAGTVVDIDAADATPDAPPPPICDETLSPHDEPCLVDERYAVFVSAGAKTSHGTRAEPAPTIAQGIALADERHVTRILICSGTYPEAVLILPAAIHQMSLSFVGGFDCKSWKPTTGRAIVAPGNERPALSVSDIPASLTFENMDFTAADALAPGASSIAVDLAGAASVTIRNVKITAGSAARGADGKAGVDGSAGAAPTDAQKGKDGVCDGPSIDQEGGQPLVATCGSQGGSGGGGRTRGRAGYDGSPGTPLTNVTPLDNYNQGLGGPDTSKEPPGDGSAGANGNGGTSGQPAAAAGKFSRAGYAPASGAPGAQGNPGQGGGGGGGAAGSTEGSKACAGASGGAGGIGGCGANGGLSGQGGGASIALLSWDSIVTLEDAMLSSSDGGAGGNGGAGGLGGLGGAGAPGGAPARYGTVGGPSYAVVFHGAAPIVKGTHGSSTAGTGGAKGLGGANPDGLHAPDGSNGATGATFAVTP